MEIENRPLQSKARYFLAFFIGTFIFIFIFILSNSISYLESQRISNFQKDTATNIFEDKLDYSLFGGDICLNENLEKISRDLGFQGKIIDDLENKLGKNDKNVLAQKKFYTLVELEHFEFIQKMNAECDFEKVIILFFYSNLDKDIDNSERVGNLINAVYNRNSDIIVYSFDVNLESELIFKLKSKYNIVASPTLVLGNDVKIYNPKNLEDIEKYFN